MSKKFSRSTRGLNQQVFVAKAINITTDTTFAAFLANAPVGEIGVFDANNALHTDAITAAESFYVAIKTTVGVRKTQLLKLSEVTARKKAYTAPVKQVSSIGWNGTGGTMGLAAAPAVNKQYEFAVIETTEGNDPFPTWNYNYTAKANENEIDVIEALAKLVNDANNLIYKSNERLVSAKVKASATYGNYALGGTTPTLTVTNGSTAVSLGGTTPTHDITVGDYISFDAAAAPTAIVGDIYKIVAVAGSGATTVWTLNRPYQGATQVFTETEAEGTRVKKVTSILETGLELTAVNEDEHFQLAIREELVNATRTTSAYTRGNGTYDHIAALEDEGTTFAGETTKNTEFAAKYGEMDRFAVVGETYDTYHLSYKRNVGFVTDVLGGNFNGMVTIAAAKSAGNVDASIATLFGL